MKNIAPLLLLLMPFFVAAQRPYWQQRTDFKIQVQLHDSDRTLDAFEEVTYTNNSPDTLSFIWFHLWPNAYKNDRTAFSNQLLQQGNTAFYFSSKEDRGYINQLNFKVNGVTARWEDHPEHIDIIRLFLAQPLLPAQTIKITTPFHVKLPRLFSRGGTNDSTFQITQWFPKPAVYDAQGWHPMPYLEQGEYYSDFGDYDVTITLPQPYVVAATGVLQTQSELEWLRTQHKPPRAASRKPAPKPYGHLKKLPVHTRDPNFFRTSYPQKTIRFTQTAVHDFAWVARKNFQVDWDTCRLSSGKIVDVFTYYVNHQKSLWQQSLAYTKDALRFYSREVGDYPYSTMHVVQSPAMPGGMEYPSLTIIGPASTEKELDVVIAHEVGHNWFQGALGSNERDKPWLDEGVNSFYEKKYTAEKYGPKSDWEMLLFETLVKQKRDQPLTTAAADFTQLNYGLVAYNKTAQWLSLIEKRAGADAFRNSMQQYYAQWQFKHPQEADLKQALASALPDTTLFAALTQRGSLTSVPKHLRVLSPLLPGSIKHYFKNPSTNHLFLSPAIGFNQYDKFMIGGLITNYGLPPSKLQFLAVPLFATGSKKWNGLSSLSYTYYSTGRIRKIEGSVTGMGFSKSLMLDSNYKKQYERFGKLAPRLRFTWNEPLLSTRERTLEAGTILIREHNFSHYVSKMSDGKLYVDSLSNESYYVNRLTWTGSEYRVLYPYQYQVQLEQSKTFYRINASGTYFFNYGKDGGATVRLFAAKFGYLTSNKLERLSATRFQPKLLGVSGEEDYTYSSYFLGRTASVSNEASVVKNSGLAAQQISLRDGGLKLRLDPFDFLQGRSENWVAVINITTTLPRRLLPAFIPLKLFFDAGTFAEARDQLGGTRLLYVGGLQLPLLNEALTIYAPLVYSAVFRDNLKTLPEQNTFLKRLTFSIDFNKLSLQRVTHNKFSL